MSKVSWLDEGFPDIAIQEMEQEENIQAPDVAPAFAAGGPVARALGERYRYREGQVEMAQLVRQTIVEGRNAVIEAGTGCGKSFAYLIPLIWSGARAMVSTANKTLQTQLWEKDVPTLQQVSPRRFTAALLKGRSNYVCLLKLGEARHQLALPGLKEGLAGLVEQLRDGSSGDVEELRLFGQLREAVTAGPHECLGGACPHWSVCYYEQARAKAEDADIVIVNHALLAVSLVRPILSPRLVVVVDEAHELAEYVINTLRIELNHDMVPQLVNDSVVIRHVSDKLRQETIVLSSHLFDFLSQSADGERRWTVQGELQHGLTLAGNLKTMGKQLARAYPPVSGGDEADRSDPRNEENARHRSTIEWAEGLADQVRALAKDKETSRNWVRYCEEQAGRSGQGGILLCKEPVQVADFLREALFAPGRRVICTGATLSVEGRFAYFHQQTGLPQDRVIERVIESPFDYPNQALLYTPRGLEPRYGPGEDDYVLDLGREVWRLIQASRGRAFILCTSARRMNQLYELISPHLEYTCYCQGEGLSRAEMLERFRDNADGAVLFATRSFWEGVDIPGEALSLVIIDKLPFAPYRDPVIQHRQQLIQDGGGSPFDEMSLPEAILALKQGVGRLIRTETDRGVIAILDSRVNTKRYGRKIVASLPRARRTQAIQDVRAFFELG
jgi:Rad3-related DNA helicase